MSDKITENDRILISLINRSADIGDGWRQVSNMLWKHISGQARPDLMELDEENKRIRLTSEGKIVSKYAV